MDKLINYLIEAARKEERKDNESVTLGNFRVNKKAGELIGSCRKNGEHHRKREQFYTKELEIAERVLKEKGVTVEVFDAVKGYYTQVASGAIGSGGLGVQQNFQAKIDQVMLDAVKKAKDKMLEHREKAEGFERYAKAFSLNAEEIIRLSVTDIEYFKLGEGE